MPDITGVRVTLYQGADTIPITVTHDQGCTWSRNDDGDLYVYDSDDVQVALYQSHAWSVVEVVYAEMVGTKAASVTVTNSLPTVAPGAPEEFRAAIRRAGQAMAA